MNVFAQSMYLHKVSFHDLRNTTTTLTLSFINQDQVMLRDLG